VRRVLALLVCLVACVATAAPAAAQREIAPPGNAGVDEYLETVPGGGGNEPLERDRRGGLPAGARRKLEGLGRDGRAAAALADAGSPRSTADGRPAGAAGQGAGPVRGDVGGAGDGGGGVASVLGQTLGADDGMGVALPILLVVTLAGAAGFAVVRRGRSRAAR
jgi:hypothetical protein